MVIKNANEVQNNTASPYSGMLNNPAPNNNTSSANTATYAGMMTVPGKQAKEEPKSMGVKVSKYGNPTQNTNNSVFASLGSLWNSGKKADYDEAWGMYQELMRNPESQYYQPFSVPTNSEYLRQLSEYTGRDYTGGISQAEMDELDLYLRQNGGYTNLSAEGTPQSNKNNTAAQNSAYVLHKLQADESNTQAAESEMSDMYAWVRYMAGKGYSDSDIMREFKRKWDKGEYKTLKSASTKADEAATFPMNFNRAINWYGEDSVYGMIAAARNGQPYNGVDSVMGYYKGDYERFVPSKWSDAARDYRSTLYYPTYLGASDTTKMNAFCQKYGVNSFDAAWVNEHHEELVENGDLDFAEKAVDNHTKATDELDRLKAECQKMIEAGKSYGEICTWVETIIARGSDFPTLSEMEANRHKGSSIDLSDSVEFALPYFTGSSKYFDKNANADSSYVSFDVNGNNMRDDDDGVFWLADAFTTYHNEKAAKDKEDLYSRFNNNQVAIDLVFLQYCMENDRLETDEDGNFVLDENGGYIMTGSVSYEDVLRYAEEKGLDYQVVGEVNEESEAAAESEMILKIARNMGDIDHNIAVKRETMLREKASKTVANPNFGSATKFMESIDDSKEGADSLAGMYQGLKDYMNGYGCTDPNALAFVEKYRGLFGGTTYSHHAFTTEEMVPGGTLTSSIDIEDQREAAYGTHAAEMLQQADEAARKGYITRDEYIGYLVDVAQCIDSYGSADAFRNAVDSKDPQALGVIDSMYMTAEGRRATMEAEAKEEAVNNATFALKVMSDADSMNEDSEGYMLFSTINGIDIHNVSDEGYDEAIRSIGAYTSGSFYNLRINMTTGEIATIEDESYKADPSSYVEAGSLSTAIAHAALMQADMFMKVGVQYGLTFDEVLEARGYDSVKAFANDVFTQTYDAYTAGYVTLMDAFSGIGADREENGDDDESAEHDFRNAEWRNEYLSGLVADGRMTQEAYDEIEAIYAGNNGELKQATTYRLENAYTQNNDRIRNLNVNADFANQYFGGGATAMEAQREAYIEGNGNTGVVGQGTDNSIGMWATAFGRGAVYGAKLHANSWLDVVWAYARQTPEEREGWYRGVYTRDELRGVLRSYIEKDVANDRLRTELMAQLDSYDGDIYDFEFDYATKGLLEARYNMQDSIQNWRNDSAQMLTPDQLELHDNVGIVTNSAMISVETIALAGVMSSMGLGTGTAMLAANMLTTAQIEGSQVFNTLMDSGVSREHATIAGVSAGAINGLIECALDVVVMNAVRAMNPAKAAVKPGWKTMLAKTTGEHVSNLFGKMGMGASGASAMGAVAQFITAAGLNMANSAINEPVEEFAQSVVSQFASNYKNPDKKGYRLIDWQEALNEGWTTFKNTWLSFPLTAGSGSMISNFFSYVQTQQEISSTQQRITAINSRVEQVNTSINEMTERSKQLTSEGNTAEAAVLNERIAESTPVLAQLRAESEALERQQERSKVFAKNLLKPGLLKLYQGAMESKRVGKKLQSMHEQAKDATLETDTAIDERIAAIEPFIEADVSQMDDAAALLDEADRMARAEELAIQEYHAAVESDETITQILAEREAAQNEVLNAQQRADNVSTELESAKTALDAATEDFNVDSPTPEASAQYLQATEAYATLQQEYDDAMADVEYYKDAYDRATERGKRRNEELYNAAMATIDEKTAAIREEEIAALEQRKQDNRASLEDYMERESSRLLSDFAAEYGEVWADRAANMGKVFQEKLQNYAGLVIRTKEQLADMISEAFHGFNVVYEDLGEGVGGRFDRGSNTIILNSGATLQEQWGWTIAHEMFHVVKSINNGSRNESGSTAFETLINGIKSALEGVKRNDTQTYWEWLTSEVAERYKDASPDVQNEEILAEGLAKIFNGEVTGNGAITVFTQHMGKNLGFSGVSQVYRFLRAQAAHIKTMGAENGFFRQKMSPQLKKYVEVLNGFADAVYTAIKENNEAYHATHNSDGTLRNAAPAAEDTTAEAPVAEAPVAAPAAAPVAETAPVNEAPVTDTTAAETATEEAPATEAPVAENETQATAEEAVEDPNARREAALEDIYRGFQYMSVESEERGELLAKAQEMYNSGLLTDEDVEHIIEWFDGNLENAPANVVKNMEQQEADLEQARIDFEEHPTSYLKETAAPEVTPLTSEEVAVNERGSDTRGYKPFYNYHWNMLRYAASMAGNLEYFLNDEYTAPSTLYIDTGSTERNSVLGYEYSRTKSNAPRMIQEHAAAYNISYRQMQEAAKIIYDSYMKGEALPNTAAVKKTEILLDDMLLHGIEMGSRTFSPDAEYRVLRGYENDTTESVTPFTADVEEDEAAPVETPAAEAVADTETAAVEESNPVAETESVEAKDEEAVSDEEETQAETERTLSEDEDEEETPEQNPLRVDEDVISDTPLDDRPRPSFSANRTEYEDDKEGLWSRAKRAVSKAKRKAKDASKRKAIESAIARGELRFDAWGNVTDAQGNILEEYNDVYFSEEEEQRLYDLSERVHNTQVANAIAEAETADEGNIWDEEFYRAEESDLDEGISTDEESDLDEGISTDEESDLDEGISTDEESTEDTFDREREAFAAKVAQERKATEEAKERKKAEEAQKKKAAEEAIIRGELKVTTNGEVIDNEGNFSRGYLGIFSDEELERLARLSGNPFVDERTRKEMREASRKRAAEQAIIRGELKLDRFGTVIDNEGNSSREYLGIFFNYEELERLERLSGNSFIDESTRRKMLKVARRRAAQEAIIRGELKVNDDGKVTDNQGNVLDEYEDIFFDAEVVDRLERLAAETAEKDSAPANVTPVEQTADESTEAAIDRVLEAAPTIGATEAIAQELEVAEEQAQQESEAETEALDSRWLSMPDSEKDATYEAADDETKEHLLDVAAKDAGYTIKAFHGTNDDFTVFDTSVKGGINGNAEGFGIYLSDTRDVTDSYGSRQISAYVKMERPATSYRKTITSAALTKLIKTTCESEAERMVADGEYPSVSEALKDTWISNYTDTYDDGSITASYRKVAESIRKMSDSDMSIVQEVMSGMAIRDYSDAMSFYHNALTPVLGIDGFITQWGNKATGKASNIYLAFDSSQIKSAELETGVPFSQRFDDSNPDIRYSRWQDTAPEQQPFANKWAEIRANQKPGTKASVFWRKGVQSRMLMAEALDYAVQNAIKEGDTNKARQLIRNMFDTINSGDELSSKTNTPTQILRTLASRVGSHLYEKIALEGNRAAYDTYTRQLMTNAVDAESFAANMTNVGRAAVMKAGANVDDVVSPGMDFDRFFFDYMTHTDAKLNPAYRPAVEKFRGLFKDANADTLKYIDKAREQLTNYFEASAVERVMTQIVNRQHLRETRAHDASKLRDATRYWVDDMEALRLVDELHASLTGLRNEGRLHREGEYTHYSAKLANAWWRGDERVDIFGNRLEGMTNRQLSDKHKINYAKDHELIDAYLFAMEAIDRTKLGRDPLSHGDINGDITATNTDYEETVKRIERENPNIAAYCNDLYELWDSFMRNVVVAGGVLSAEEYDHYHETHPHYAPLMRDDQTYVHRAMGAEDGLVHIHKAEGNNNSKVMSPTETMYVMANQFAQKAAAMQVLKTFDEMYTSVEGMGALAARFTDEDITEGKITSVPRDSLILLNEDGTHTYYQVHDEVLKNALQGNMGDVFATTPLISMMGRFTGMMSKLTTGVNILFAGKNAFRDFAHTVNYGSAASNYFTGAIKWFDSFFDVARHQINSNWGSEQVKDFSAMGGYGWYRTSINSNESVRNWINEAYGNRSKVKSVLSAPMRFVDGLNGIIESTSRFMEYKHGVNATGTNNWISRSTNAIRDTLGQQRSDTEVTAESKRKAFMASMEATVDFKRHGNGAAVQILKNIVPFFGATLQGQYQDIRIITDSAERHRLAPRLAKMVLNNAIMGALSAAAFMLSGIWKHADGYDPEDEQEDLAQMYLNMTDSMKRQYILIPGLWLDGARDVYRIPLTQGSWSQIAYEFGRKAVEEAYRGNRDDALHTGFGADLVQTAIAATVGSLTDMTTIVSPFFDVAQNKNWYGSPIVSASLQKQYLTDQYDSGTSSFFISAAMLMDRVLGSIGLDEDNVFRKAFSSPVNMEYVLKQYTGIIGQTIPAMISPDRYTGEVTPIASLGRVFKNAWTLDMDSSSEIGDVYASDSAMIDQVVASVGKGYGRLSGELTEAETSEAVSKAKAMTSSGGILYETDKKVSALYGEIRDIMGDTTLSRTERENLCEEKYAEIRALEIEAIKETSAFKEQYMGGSIIAAMSATLGGKTVQASDPVSTMVYKLPLHLQEDLDAGEEYMVYARDMYGAYGKQHGTYSSTMIPHYATTFKRDNIEYEVPEMYREQYQAVYDNAYRDMASQVIPTLSVSADPLKEWARVHSYADSEAKNWLVEILG